MKTRREKLYEDACARYRGTRRRPHPTKGVAGDRYADWALDWWMMIQRAFPGTA